jgi:hypothetical protein
MTEDLQAEELDNLSIYLSIALDPLGSWPLFQFLNLYKFSRTPWTGDQPVARPPLTHRTTQIQNKRTQTSMPRMVFEPTIPAFEQAKQDSCLRPRGHSDPLLDTLQGLNWLRMESTFGRSSGNALDLYDIPFESQP